MWSCSRSSGCSFPPTPRSLPRTCSFANSSLCFKNASSNLDVRLLPHAPSWSCSPGSSIGVKPWSSSSQRHSLSGIGLRSRRSGDGRLESQADRDCHTALHRRMGDAAISRGARGPQPYRFVIHERDSIFSSSLDGALNDFGVRLLRPPVVEEYVVELEKCPETA